MPYAEITMQSLGVVTYSSYILMKLPYRTISYMWGVFCLIPFLINVVSVIARCIHNKKYDAVSRL